MTSSSRCCRRRTLLDECPIDPAWSSCLWRASSPVRQHAYPCRKNTPAQPAYPYIFSSALRAAGESMEAALSNRTSHSDTVKLPSKLSSCLLFGIKRGRPAAPKLSIERRRRRRLRLAMGGLFPSIVAHEGIRHRRMACHGNACSSLPRLHGGVAQPGRHAHEGHVGPDERSVCVRSFGVVRLFVLSCSCPTRTVPVGVEGKNNHYLKLIAIVDSTVR